MIANATQVEMVIKEISSVGADVRAGNELDFREIFRDSRHVYHHHKDNLQNIDLTIGHHQCLHQRANGFKETVVHPG